MQFNHKDIKTELEASSCKVFFYLNLLSSLKKLNNFELTATLGWVVSILPLREIELFIMADAILNRRSIIGSQQQVSYESIVSQ